jgi:hypothetical protein
MLIQSSAALTQQGGAAVAPPAGGGVAGVQSGTSLPGAPLSGLSLRALRAQRDEISRQLSNVNDRRNEIATQLRNAAPGADRAGLEGRLAVLDKRIADMESSLAITGKLVQDAQGGSPFFTEDPPPLPGNAPDRDQITAIAIVFTVVVLAPLAWAWARAILRRSTKLAEQPSKQLMDRLDRMEEGIETVALEVERISEGQRFVTKVIAESRGEPLAIPRGESS